MSPKMAQFLTRIRETALTERQAWRMGAGLLLLGYLELELLYHFRYGLDPTEKSLFAAFLQSFRTLIPIHQSQVRDLEGNLFPTVFKILIVTHAVLGLSLITGAFQSARRAGSIFFWIGAATALFFAGRGALGVLSFLFSFFPPFAFLPALFAVLHLLVLGFFLVPAYLSMRLPDSSKRAFTTQLVVVLVAILGATAAIHRFSHPRGLDPGLRIIKNYSHRFFYDWEGAGKKGWWIQPGPSKKQSLRTARSLDLSRRSRAGAAREKYDVLDGMVGPDGETIYGGTIKGEIVKINPRTKEITLWASLGNEKYLVDTLWAHQPNRVWVEYGPRSTFDRYLGEISEGESEPHWKLPFTQTDRFSLAPSGSFIVQHENRTLQIGKVGSPKLVNLPIRPTELGEITELSDGSALVVAVLGNRGTVLRVKMETGEILAQFSIEGASKYSQFSIDPTGRYIALEAKNLSIWEMNRFFK